MGRNKNYQKRYICQTLILLMLKRRLILLFCIFGFVSLQAQKTEIHKLLEQASEMVFYNPKEAKAIAEHLLKLTDNPVQKAEAYYTSAVASYIMGQYDEALNQAFESKKLLLKNTDFPLNTQNGALIHRIFNQLQLSDYQVDYFPGSFIHQDILQTEDLLVKAQFFAEENLRDSIEILLNQAEPSLNLSNPGYLEVMYYGLKGDLSFGKKDFSEALKFYRKADSVETKLNNPFLGEEIYKKLTATYLALDSIVHYQKSNEIAKQLTSKSFEIENKASNQAYNLMTKSFDESYRKKENFYFTTFVLLGILVILGLVLKIIFGIRNKNKEKTLIQLLNYLKNHEIKAQQPEMEISEKEIFLPSSDEGVKESEFLEKDSKKDIPSKPGTLLKESEEHILSGLSKFENSTRFTQKDMSLGKLAARLNTNTKYLSEVINRHKEKNFSAYINELRINYIIQKLKSDSAYLHYKVSYLADECGFSSHSSFTTVFKSIVGVSPSVFIELIKDDSKNINDMT